MPDNRLPSVPVPGVKVVFLGTGTSVGIPAIGCTCPVCLSDDPRNKRLRTSLYLQAGGTSVVVDTAPDFRMQAITHKIPRVDALVFTHSHADHILGFDDIRRYNTMQDGRIPAYGSADTIADMNRIFDYIHHEHAPGVYRPRVDFHEVSGPFQIGAIQVEPFQVVHAPKMTYGYRFEAAGRSLGYFPDCHEMAPATVQRLQGLDVMVLDALRHKPHSTHLTLAESIKTLEKIGARKSFIIHMCHDLDHEQTQKALPESMFVSYDGLILEW
ncbi:MAG: MBL fold metallo-hydrolase [bacterium]